MFNRPVGSGEVIAAMADSGATLADILKAVAALPTESGYLECRTLDNGVKATVFVADE